MNNSNNIIKYLHILKCPKDHSDLVIKDSNIKNNQIIDGELISKKDKNIYKIRNKIKFKLAYLYALSVYHVIPNFLKRNIVAKFIPFIYLPNKEWSILDTIDSITPVYQSCYTKKQVHDLFETNNMHSIKNTNWGVSHIGKKN